MATPPASNKDLCGTNLPHHTKEHLAGLQREDTAIASILRSWPDAPASRDVLPEAKKLTKQLSRLEFIDSVLYRRVDDPHLGPLQQLVLPASLRPDILSALHDSMGHQGVHRSKRPLLATQLRNFPLLFTFLLPMSTSNYSPSDGSNVYLLPCCLH